MRTFRAHFNLLEALPSSLSKCRLLETFTLKGNPLKETALCERNTTYVLNYLQEQWTIENPPQVGEEEQSRGDALREVYLTEDSRRNFREYLQTEYSEENLDFLVDIDAYNTKRYEFEQPSNISYRLGDSLTYAKPMLMYQVVESALKIFALFVCDNSEKEINLPGFIKQKLVSVMNEFTEALGLENFGKEMSNINLTDPEEKKKYSHLNVNANVISILKPDLFAHAYQTTYVLIGKDSLPRYEAWKRKNERLLKREHAKKEEKEGGLLGSSRGSIRKFMTPRVKKEKDSKETSAADMKRL